MPRISLVSGFKNPATRPRYLVWSAVVVLVLAVVVIAALGVTSSYWFCANGCHKVQDDTITAYQASTHSEVSCMACHMPVNSGPITFLLHKSEALGELYLTVTGNYEIPLNGESHLALEMESEQCTQCHSENRPITPSQGIIIDHEIHDENHVACTICHNRIAHDDRDIEFVNVDPKTGELNHPHADFMTMTACFRCHTQDEPEGPPGACEACHPADFELRPANHFEAGFYELGGDSYLHAELAWEALGETTATAEVVVEDASVEGEHDTEIPSVDEIFYCGTCHSESFCTDCHGVVMPHPADFAEGHGDLGRTQPAVCANCHATGAAAASGAGLEFCNSCHHPESDPTKAWIPQHFDIVRTSGAEACFECHNPTYCAECHVRGAIQ